MSKFLTKEVNTSIYDFAFDVYDAESAIHWDYEIDKRDWGLRDIIVAVYRIDLKFQIEDEEGFTDCEETIFVKDPWHVTYEFKRNGILAPTSCQINWKQKRIELKF